MPDRDAAPDPVDEAYAQAEAHLFDEAARAERRARVLAAVDAEPTVPSSPKLSPVQRYGGWLAAAGVVGLSVLVSNQLYQPARPQPQTVPATRPAPASTAPAPTVPATPEGAKPSAGPAAPAAAPRTPPTGARAVAQHAAPDGAKVAAAPPLAGPSFALSSPAISAQEEGNAPAGARNEAEPAAAQARDRAAEPARLKPSSLDRAPDKAARLRAAAAAGRLDEMEALLSAGVPVDAADANGETALMKSIQGDHPAAAAMLRRHGASLERRNGADQRARDMAIDQGDPELDQALGLGP